MRALDDQSWVSSWLWSTDQDEYIGDVSELGDFTVCEPATPRRQSTPTYEDDLSPTNTSFSDNSIFDPSDAKRDPWFDDPFADDVPDLAPADNDGQTVISKVRWLSADLAAPPVEIDRSDNTSDLLVEPPTELAHDEQHEADSVASTCTTAVNVRADPDDPRIARITSCAQCIVANLPCSRTYPCCTRCKRNGHAKLCLLHRMRFLEELDEDKLLSCTIPVLLKVKNEDEAILQQKIEFLKEVRVRRILDLSVD